MNGGILLKKLLLFLLLCTTVVGCNSEGDKMIGEANFAGTITDKRSGSILLEEKNSEVVWIIVPEGESINDYQLGQDVSVWITGGLMESDPPQAKALQIEVVND